MKAAIVPSPGKQWEVREVPTPEPGPGQVLIRVRASGMCFTDVHQSEGEIPGSFPRVLGHEPVGEVVALGVGVTNRKIGDRVGVPWDQASCGRCEWCLSGRAIFCEKSLGTGASLPGGHAEFMPAFASATVLLPEGLSYEQAAPIFCAGYTVYSGLRVAEPKPHEIVAVVGIGGLGHIGLQYAKAAGFTVIAVSRSPDKDRLIRELGADEIVRDGKDLARAGGADIVLGTSNSIDAMANCVEALRPDGRLVLMGFEAKAQLKLSPLPLIMRRIRIIGSRQNHPQHLYEALDYSARGKVRTITETYPLSEVTRAYERVKEGDVRFRAVITFDGKS